MFGALLNYMITNGRGKGDAPFSFVSPRSLNAAVSPQLEAVIMRALEAEPQKRFQTIWDMKRAHFPHLAPDRERVTYITIDHVEKAANENVEDRNPIKSMLGERLFNAPLYVKFAIAGTIIFSLMIGAGLLLIGREGNQPLHPPVIGRSPLVITASEFTPRVFSTVTSPGHAGTIKPAVTPGKPAATPGKPAATPGGTGSMQLPVSRPPRIHTTAISAATVAITPIPSPTLKKQSPNVPEAPPLPGHTGYPAKDPRSIPARPQHGGNHPPVVDHGRTPEPPRGEGTRGLSLVEKREFLAKLTDMYPGNFDEPRGLKAGRGVKVSGTSTRFSLTVPDGFLEVTAPLPGTESTRYKELERLTFANVGNERSDLTLRFMGIMVLQIPRSVSEESDYTYYLEGIEEIGARELKVHKAKGVFGNPCFAATFNFRPSSLKITQKYGQILYAGVEKDRLFVLTANTSIPNFEYFTPEMSDFFSSFER